MILAVKREVATTGSEKKLYRWVFLMKKSSKGYLRKMIKKNSDMTRKTVEHMRDGKGSVDQMLILDGRDMAKHARLFGMMTLDKGCSIGLHTHTKETEYYFILAGEGIVTEADGDKPVSKGDVVITGDGESHAIRNEGTAPLVFIALIVLDD